MIDSGSTPFNIIAICPTYNRPQCVLNLIRQFELQSHRPEHRYLLVYDDAGQFDPQDGDRWSILSTANRHAQLGAKFDTLVAFAIARCVLLGWDPDETAIALMEDDDAYFPEYLAAHAATLASGAQWSAPSKILANDSVGRGNWHVASSLNKNHGAWAYRISAYLEAGGYPVNQTAGFDFVFRDRLRAIGIKPRDTLLCGCGPIYLYRWFSAGQRNGSQFGDAMMTEQGTPERRHPGPVAPQLDAETAGYYAEFGFSTT